MIGWNCFIARSDCLATSRVNCVPKYSGPAERCCYPLMPRYSKTHNHYEQKNEPPLSEALPPVEPVLSSLVHLVLVLPLGQLPAFLE